MGSRRKSPVHDTRASKRMTLARKVLSIALSMLLAAWLAPSAALAEPAATGGFGAAASAVRDYPDVADDEWFVQEGWLDYVSKHELMTGDGVTGQFMPNRQVLRGQVAMVLWRMEGSPVAKADSFDDVDYSLYYGDSISWARSVGVVTGDVGTNNFRPDDSITRENLALMLARYAALKGADVSTDCAAMDSIEGADEVDSWAREGLAWAVDVGIISGNLSTGTPRLLPKESATRAEFAKMATVLHRDVLGLDVLVDYVDGATVVAPDVYERTGEHAAVVDGSAVAAIEQGDVVVLEPSEANPAGGAIKVESVTALPDGSASIAGTEPEFSEVVEELSFTGTTAELVSFEPAPGVEVLSESEARAVFGDEAELFSQTFSIGSFGTVGVDLSALYTIEYRDGGFSTIDLAFETDASFNWEYDASISDAIKCGTATFVTNVPGLMIGADIYVTYSVEGGIKLEAEATTTAGVVYSDDNPADDVAGAWTTSCESGFTCEAQLTASARGGIEPALVLRYLMIDLVDVSLGMGQEAAAEVAARPSGMVCSDIAMWVYLDLSVGQHDSVAGKLGLQNTWELLGRESNPTLIERHAENGMVVEECTWKEEPDPEPDPDPDPDPEDPTGPVDPSAFFEGLPDAFVETNSRPPESEVSLNVGPDGSVAGEYYSVDEHSYPHEFGDTGQYYTSTRYIGSMTGSFASPTRVSEHVYELSLVGLDAPTSVGDSWLEGDVRYIESVYAGFVLIDEDPWYVVAPGATAPELFEFGITDDYLDPAIGEMSVWMLHNSGGRGTYLERA